MAKEGSKLKNECFIYALNLAPHVHGCSTRTLVKAYIGIERYVHHMTLQKMGKGRTAEQGIYCMKPTVVTATLRQTQRREQSTRMEVPTRPTLQVDHHLKLDIILGRLVGVFMRGCLNT